MLYHGFDLTLAYCCFDFRVQHSRPDPTYKVTVNVAAHVQFLCTPRTLSMCRTWRQVINTLY